MKEIELAKNIFSNILPKHLFDSIIEKINYLQLNEIRLRCGKPIVVILGTQNYFVCEEGITNNVGRAIFCTKSDIDNIVFRASECSIYAVNEQIKQGFLTIDGGIRIGISGTGVCEDGKIKTIKNYSSLVIRIPHKIRNSSLFALKYILEKEHVNNTLIISPPGCGKTTFLRDFLFQLSQRNICLNVLAIDERGEIAGNCVAENSLLESNFCDVLSFVKKSEAIMLGVRALSPNVVLCDEIGAKDDADAIENACSLGVSVVASAHADSIESLKKKPNFEKVLEKKLFSRFIVLSSKNGLGTVDGIFDENFAPLYLGEIWWNLFWLGLFWLEWRILDLVFRNFIERENDFSKIWFFFAENFVWK